MSVKGTWDYSHMRPLTEGERRFMVHHERLHLEHARSTMTALEYERASARVDALERGDGVEEATAPPTQFPSATDDAVNRELDRLLTKKLSR